MTEIIQRIAAKAVIANGEGKILILREAKTNPEGTQPGSYDIPGGRLNYGESFFEALKREVHEETGLEVELGPPLAIGEWSPTIGGQTQQIVAVFVGCKALTEDIRLSDEHDEYVWIDPAAMANYGIMLNESSIIQTWLKKGEL